MQENGLSPYLSTADVQRLYSVDDSTVLHWMRDGIQAPAGTVRLEYLRVGGRYKTTQAWLDKFFAALHPDGRPPVMAETPSEFQRRARKEKERAEKMLNKKRKQA